MMTDKPTPTIYRLSLEISAFCSLTYESLQESVYVIPSYVELSKISGKLIIIFDTKKSVDMHVELFYMIYSNVLVELGCHSQCFLN